MGKTATSRPSLVENVTTILSERHREIMLLGSLLVSTFAMVSLIGYRATDPTLLHPGTGQVANPCGPLGALLADSLFALLGYGAWAVFGSMVLSVLALAGRRVWRWGTAALSSCLYVVLLATAHLLFRPGDAFAPGGWVGAVVSESLEAVIGTVGAWLVVLGGGVLVATLLFQIRWTRVVGRIVDRAESWLPVLGRWSAAGAGAVQGLAMSVLRRAGQQSATSARRLGKASWGTVRRMGRSLTRVEGESPQPEDEEPEEEQPVSTGGLEELGGDPDGFVPASQIERTAIEGGVELDDGSRIEADVVCVCCGNDAPTYPFFSDDIRGLLEDREGGPALYRHLVHPQIDGLGFSGYNHGFLHIALAEVGALWQVAAFQGDLELPTPGAVTTRGWFQLRRPPRVDQDTPLVIVQFPEQRVQVAFGSVVERDDPFVIYRVDTEPGSSGSPCFAMYRLVAVHKGSFPAREANRGVLLDELIDTLKAASGG